MDPRKFRAPVQCNLCRLLLYTLTEVLRHCSHHSTVDFLCHHCLANFDNKSAIAEHMNQKGAHRRPPFDPRTYDSALPSPTPSTSAVLPLSQPVALPVPASPIPAIATLSDVSLDQLLRDIDTSTLPGTDASASSISPQAASSYDVSPTVGAPPGASVSYPPSEYRQLSFVVVLAPPQVIADPTAIGGRGTRSVLKESVATDGDGATVWRKFIFWRCCWEIL